MGRILLNAGRRLALVASILLIGTAACSKSESPEEVSPTDPDGWWNTWKVEKVEFPAGTRFELETIYTDGSRRGRALVVHTVDPAPGGGFNVTLEDGSIFQRLPIPPPISSSGPIQTRNKDLVSVTTPAGTFLAGRLWRTERRGHVPYETDTWVVPGIPLPVQTWSRPVTDKHLYDPPSGDTIPPGTFLERLVRIQKQ